MGKSHRSPPGLTDQVEAEEGPPGRMGGLLDGWGRPGRRSESVRLVAPHLASFSPDSFGPPLRLPWDGITDTRQRTTPSSSVCQPRPLHSIPQCSQGDRRIASIPDTTADLQREREDNRLGILSTPDKAVHDQTSAT